MAVATCGMASLLAQAMPQPPAYSTHDWTVTGSADPLAEGWADVKTPWGIAGERRTYSVGTVEVRFTGPDSSPAQFSLADALVRPVGWPLITILGTAARRQVALLQVVNEDQSIAWQRFFYGDTNLAGSGLLRQTNARAIAVWPSVTEADTRIAICGELTEELIPLEDYGTPTVVASNNIWQGFIAVYDGLGELQWTHHLYGDAVLGGKSAVTDLTIRRELRNEGWADVVTYCGITTYGAPVPGFPLSHDRPFAALPGESGGDTDQGLNQWDGFVGRVVFDTSTNVEFHSTVGGPGQDGLFGIAELSRNRFVAVGSCQTGGPSAFPYTIGFGALDTTQSAGVVAVFDASPVGNITLEGVRVLGGAYQGQSGSTHLRDVLVGFNANARSPLPPASPVDPGHMIYVAGSTTDANVVVYELTTDPAGTGAVDAAFLSYSGGSDGVFFSLADDPGNTPALRSAGYIGGPAQDGLTGVGGWNEYGEHVTVGGWIDAVPSNPGFTGGDILLHSLLSDSASESFPVPQQPPVEALIPLHEATIGGTLGGSAFYNSYGYDRPCAMGPDNATSGGFSIAWNEFAMGNPAGGGVAVDARARVTVVGTTFSEDYPFSPIIGRASDGSFSGQQLPDAVRTTIDLLPIGIGRTDGAGDPLPGGLPAGFTGGTTPLCGIEPFGIQIGADGAGVMLDDLRYPLLQRMLIEYDGPGPDGISPLSGASMVVVRPPSTPGVGSPTWQPSVIGAALTIGFPQPSLLPDGLEIWTLPNPVVLVSVQQPNRPFRQCLVPLSNGTLVAIPLGVELTAQLVCLVANPVPALNTGGVCQPALTTVVAGPALWIDNN